MLIKFPNLSKRALIYKYFDLLNAAQPNSDKHIPEREVMLLTEFLLLPEKFQSQPFSSKAKDKIIQQAQENLNWELTKVNINNKLYKIQKRGFLRRDDDGVLYMAPYLTQTTKELVKAHDTESYKDIIFRFDYTGLKGSSGTDSSSTGTARATSQESSTDSV